MDGNLTSWEIFAKNTLPVQLIIYRQNGDSYSVVGRSKLETLVVGKNSFTMAPI